MPEGHDPSAPRSSLEGRVALITGASRGIGAAVARSLHEAGVKLGLASRGGDDLGLPGAVAVRCDVRDRDEVQAAVDATVDRFGRLDTLIANAGVGAYGPFVELPPDTADEIVAVNLTGTMNAARAAIPHLVAAGGADLIAIASVAGLRGLPGEAAYCASKFGQVGFVRALDHELREQDVRCTAICPGGVATDFAMGAGRTPDMPELKGMMSPQDVADVVLFALTRPRGLRIMDVALRPISEPSAG
jgi:3-oxoacyl-[acyl-carrier protein] reductase